MINRNLIIQQFRQIRDKYNIILKEKEVYPHREYPRRIVISIWLKNKIYSIKSFEVHAQNHKEEYKEIYSLEVKGSNSLKHIKKNLRAIIQDKVRDKDVPYPIYYPNY